MENKAIICEIGCNINKLEYKFFYCISYRRFIAVVI